LNILGICNISVHITARSDTGPLSNYLFTRFSNAFKSFSDIVIGYNLGITSFFYYGVVGFG